MCYYVSAVQHRNLTLSSYPNNGTLAIVPIHLPAVLESHAGSNIYSLTSRDTKLKLK